jgi:glyoxylase-like metal-dependent hydrolase (beta-lactamase superfamily II)
MMTIQQFTFNPLQENTYVIYTEKGECCIIDPGCYSSNERNELKNFIHEHQLQPKYLLNTHCHFDHLFGNKFIHQEFGLSLHLNSKEKPVLDNAPMAALMWGLPFDQYNGNLIYLDEGDTIQLGNDKFEIIFTPGHSPGSISFYCSEQQFIVAGDVLFRTGIGRTDLPGGDFDTLIDSIQTKLFVLPEQTTVYCGHGPQTSIGFEKRHNPFLNS